ncbi:hypothetical protein ACO2Q8_02220 [Larkinella sp. VNQ87]|uniref:hypothetical protein n=1 Tax=Larkinella sp. VNQ87 TaxID=3400921 RepID=UPI003C0DB399
MTLPVYFQRSLQTRPLRHARFYNELGQSDRKPPRPERPDWLVVFTFVMIALTLLFS